MSSDTLDALWLTLDSGLLLHRLDSPFTTLLLCLFWILCGLSGISEHCVPVTAWNEPWCYQTHLPIRKLIYTMSSFMLNLQKINKDKQQKCAICCPPKPMLLSPKVPSVLMAEIFLLAWVTLASLSWKWSIEPSRRECTDRTFVCVMNNPIIMSK